MHWQDPSKTSGGFITSTLNVGVLSSEAFFSVCWEEVAWLETVPWVHEFSKLMLFP